MTHENAINVFTDGSSFSKPRRGGMGLRLVTIGEDGHEICEEVELVGHEGATNNQMELLACIKGVEAAAAHPQIGQVRRIYVFTDSMYVVENMKLAMFQWPKTRWCNANGRPIDNAELWKKLVHGIKKAPRPVIFEWIKGHSKNLHNRAVDKLAKRSAKGALLPPLQVASVRRKLSSRSVEPGSVQIAGQCLKIRIVTDTYLRTQRLYKYKYEVLPNGPSSGLVDLIYSKECLRAGHHYEVRLNDDSKNPRIVEVLNELVR